MSLRDLQTRLINQAVGPGGTVIAFIIASMRTWQYQTAAPCSPVQLTTVTTAPTLETGASITINGTAMYVSSGRSGSNNDSTMFTFDITNPQVPVLKATASFPIAGNPVTQLPMTFVANIGAKAYFPNGTSGRITVVDCTTITAPTLVSQATVVQANPGAISSDGTFLYCSGTAAFVVYNSSLVVQGSVALSAALGIGQTLAGSSVFVVTGAKQFKIVDISVPSTPVIRSTVTLPDNFAGSGNSQSPFQVVGSTLYVLSNGTTSGGLFTNPNIYVYDISDPAHPSLIQTINIVDPDVTTLGMTSFLVSSGSIGITVGTGPVKLIVTTLGGSQIGKATVNPSGAQIVSGAILKAA